MVLCMLPRWRCTELGFQAKAQRMLKHCFFIYVCLVILGVCYALADLNEIIPGRRFSRYDPTKQLGYLAAALVFSPFLAIYSITQSVRGKGQFFMIIYMVGASLLTLANIALAGLEFANQDFYLTTSVRQRDPS